jgi:hypothetical protein
MATEAVASWRPHHQVPELTPSSIFVQSWDPALKPGQSNARSACTTWLFHDKKYYLVDVSVGQYDYVILKNMPSRSKGAALDTVYNIALAEKELSKIGAVLPSRACYESNFV